MRHTRAHTGNRRSHHALKSARFAVCKDCGSKHLMHRVCGVCGKYRGRAVVDVLKKTTQKISKKKAEQKEEAKAEGKTETN